MFRTPTTTSRPSCRAEFKIAIVCALPEERNAVEDAMTRDYKDDDEPPVYRRAEGDTNVYGYGELGGEPVVLACMADMGSLAASEVVRDIHRSFRNLSIVFLVGITGGAPFQADGSPTGVRLGDIIISSSMLKGDFGKQLQGRFDTTVDFSNRLPPAAEIVRKTLVAIKNEGGDFRRLVKKTNFDLTAHPRLKHKKYKCPGRTADHIYASDYRHKHHDLGDCDVCTNCHRPEDPVCTVAEQSSCETLGCQPIEMDDCGKREFPDQAWIHVGPYVSTDGVMKSAYRRDQLVKLYSALAIEMEGPGVWGSMPTMVIKGVVDYADSHKNKVWRLYPAARAALCTKAIIELMEFELSDRAPFPAATISRPTDECLNGAEHSRRISPGKKHQLRPFLNPSDVPESSSCSSDAAASLPSSPKSLQTDGSPLPDNAKYQAIIEGRHVYLSRNELAEQVRLNEERMKKKQRKKLGIERPSLTVENLQQLDHKSISDVPSRSEKVGISRRKSSRSGDLRIESGGTVLYLEEGFPEIPWQEDPTYVGSNVARVGEDQDPRFDIGEPVSYGSRRGEEILDYEVDNGVASEGRRVAKQDEEQVEELEKGKYPRSAAGRVFRDIRGVTRARAQARGGNPHETRLQEPRSQDLRRLQLQALTILSLLLMALEDWLQRRLSSSLITSLLTSAATFEDAHGHVMAIDLNFVSSWKAFECSLGENFAGMPDQRGLQRVIQKQYRLHDGVRDDLIDPNRLPSFSVVFAAGRYVRMSIYFDWHEVNQEACPSCGLSQATELGMEIVCGCGLQYRVLDSILVDLALPDPDAIGATYPAVSASGPVDGHFDRPGNFQRISIGKRPQRLQPRLPEMPNDYETQSQTTDNTEQLDRKYVSRIPRRSQIDNAGAQNGGLRTERYLEFKLSESQTSTWTVAEVRSPAKDGKTFYKLRMPGGKVYKDIKGDEWVPETRLINPPDP